MFSENTNELAQNKLLLLYIINKSTKNLNNKEITNFILEQNYMNFFLIQEYLSELVEENFIENVEEKEEKLYVITNKGRMSLEFFTDRIPPSIKESVDIKFGEIDLEKKKSQQIIGEYFQNNKHQYIVNLKLIENEDTLFSLYFSLPTEDKAVKFTETWKDKTESIYKNILNMLADEDITSI